MEIKNFNLSISNLPYLFAKINDLDIPAGYVCNVTLKNNIRSTDQNNLYWEFVTEFGSYFGYDKDFTHDLLRYKFLYKIVNFDGDEVKQLLSTTKQNTKTMNEYIEKCFRYGSENGFIFDKI